jgi:hypothetical protein
MKLFKMINWQLQVDEEAWGYIPFKKILDRDKTKDKTIAFKEMFFIWNYCDVKSDYMHLTDLDIRTDEIKKDIALPKTWKLDKVIQEAIDFYNKKSITVIEQLYRQTLKAASDIGEYLGNTKELLNERDDRDKPIYDVSKITTAVQKVPKLMKDLKLSSQISEIRN